MSKGHFINGQWQAGKGSEFSSVNPATGEAIWHGNEASADEVASAVAAAQDAFEGWRRQTPEQRMEIIGRYVALLGKHKEEMASLISRETGKVLWDARGEAGAMAAKADISEKAYHARTGYTQSETGDVRNVLRHRPHGVLAVFGPYNFPGHLPNGHIIPALIAGNTVVFKPSEQTPAVAELMVSLWQEAGLPAGVLNLIQGAAETGKALSAADIDGILFTGSAHVGALLHKQLGGQPQKMLALEMGGNNPLIAWDANDKQAAALIMVQSAFLTSGQRCTCARRLILPTGSVGDALLDALIAMTARLKVGAADENPAPFMGPLVALKEAQNMLAMQKTLQKNGGKTLVEAKQLREGLPFISPGIIDVTEVKDRDDKECFGPLLQVIRVKDFNAALAEANNTRFGLSAGLISEDKERYETFISEIHAGIVNWNRPTNGASSAMPFGGVGISGNHRPSAYYAADYCAYPIASMETETLAMPDSLPTGIKNG